jgi:hypothetical protein
MRGLNQVDVKNGLSNLESFDKSTLLSRAVTGLIASRLAPQRSTRELAFLTLWNTTIMGVRRRLDKRVSRDLYHVSHGCVTLAYVKVWRSSTTAIIIKGGTITGKLKYDNFMLPCPSDITRHLCLPTQK